MDILVPSVAKYCFTEPSRLAELMMAERINKRTLARRLAARMNSDEATALRWIDATVDMLYESFAAGESVTLEGFGGFYIREERSSWVFRFNPGQKLRALFGWSSMYRVRP